MKDNKGVSIPKHYTHQTERVYEVYAYKSRDERRLLYNGSKDVACQYERRLDITDYRRGPSLKRREMYFSGLPKQVYAYHGTRSVTDVGVGSVKALPRKRVKRIYLPETDDRGIGSEDLSAFVTRRTRHIPKSGYYDTKKTSSKCVGGIAEYNTGCVLTEKLSPIVQTRSEATSPSEHRINAEMAINTIGKDTVTITTQVENDLSNNIQGEEKHKDNSEAPNNKLTVNDSQQPSGSKDKEQVTLEKSNDKSKKTNQVDKGVSSDSLVEQVHNLENPSDYKQSHASVDPMENKLEREYRKMFTSQSKNKRSNDKLMRDMKSTSVLRRRFEALRRGLIKKEDSTKNSINEKQECNQLNCPIRKDVSIASDPPSLEGRSYSNTKTYSPFHIKSGPEKSSCKPSTSRKKSSERGKDNLQWSQMGDDYSDSQGVKGMFKLWGEKFDLEEDRYKKRSTPTCSYSRVNTFTKQPDKKAELKLEKTVKKDGRKFFFFKKRSKEKTKPYKSKKGLTAGRCELGEGLMIKMDGNALSIDEPKKKMDIPEEILRQQWLNKYLTPTIESKNSVQIRWNNNIYATSSSTVFELMDTVYQGTGIVFTSKSEVTTGDSSMYRSQTQHVNFARQEIEAWMIPKTVTNPPKQKCLKTKRAISKHNTEVRMSAQKWFIDKAKAFSRKIEVVLHTKNVINTAKESSSEYLRIDIPKGFFIESSSDENRKPSSDEQVFKIVEYETELDLKRRNKDLDTGDHPVDDLQLIKKKSSIEGKLETVINKLPVRREVVIQGSDVNIQKPCGVIGVGIITQKDLREIRKPILKIQDNLTDEESVHNLQHQKKCEFAESYLQEYYRHWTPLGMGLYSWCVSDSRLRCNSQDSRDSSHNQGDGSKSCFKIYDGFQTSAVLSSTNQSEPGSPSNVIPSQENLKSEQENYFKSKWLNKLKIKKSRVTDAMRATPKDSFEVFKRRKLYAASDKSKWADPDFSGINPSSDTKSIDSKTAKMSLKSRPCRKHVSLKEDGTYEYISKSEGSPGGILMFRGASGCDICRQAAGICSKHAKVDPVSSAIPDPPCLDGCMANPNPPCSPNVTSSSGRTINLPFKKQVSPPIASLQPNKCHDSLKQIGSSKDPSAICPHSPSFPKTQSSQNTQSTEKEKPPEHVKSSSQAKNSNEVQMCPPCRNTPSPKNTTEIKQCPWPLRSKHSNQSIPVVPACIPCKSKCSQVLPLSQKTSNSSLDVEKQESLVKCTADCVNKPEITESKKKSPGPASHASSKIKECRSATSANECKNITIFSKILGKIKSSQKKIHTKEGSKIEVIEKKNESSVIRLNSKEKITISMKKPTPSTEEIREGMNIKVKDDDGNTLYERRDYKKAYNSTQSSVLGDMYKAPDVNRISTPIIVKNIQTSQERVPVEEKENKSDTSIGNVIEIQFKLKISPGDKATEINMEKDKNIDNVHKIKKSEISTAPQSVLVVKNNDDHISAKSSAKNDVNIRIVIKNFKTRSDKKRNVKYNDDFSTKISNKFQTVSTGYSDVYTGQNMDKDFSVHRATIDLTDSNEKSRTPTNPSENKTRIEFKDQEPKKITSSQKLMLNQSATKFKTNFIVEKSYSAEKLNNEDFPDEEVRPTIFTDSEDQDNIDTTTSNAESGVLIAHPMNKEQKKELLKKVFERADRTKVKTKDKMKNIRDMLKVVLTSDSSGQSVMAVTSNDLLKDLTYASLRSDYFKDTDSINNIYNIESILSLGIEHEPKYYPSEEQNSECSKSDDGSLKDETEQRCMCSTFAERLKLCNTGAGGCCCCGNRMISEEVSCNIQIEDEISSMDEKTLELFDIETQNSQHSTGNSARKNNNVYENNADNLTQLGVITAKLESRTTKSPIDIASLPNDNSNVFSTQNLNRNIALNISDEDRNILVKTKPTNVTLKVKKHHKCQTPKILTTSDILQSYAIKKAVLEIYAETTVDADGEHTVAKLPKFVYGRESEICRYQQKLCHYNSVCKRNIVMMSVQR